MGGNILHAEQIVDLQTQRRGSAHVLTPFRHCLKWQIARSSPEIIDRRGTGGHIGKIILMCKGEQAMGMNVEIKNNKLCIEIDLEEPTPSASGKTLVVASTHGNMVTSATVKGKPVTIGLNAYIKP